MKYTHSSICITCKIELSNKIILKYCILFLLDVSDLLVVKNRIISSTVTFVFTRAVSSVQVNIRLNFG